MTSAGADKPRYGSALGGERHGMAKLTWDQVLAIRESTSKQATIARRFGISQSQVSAIRAGKSWVA